MRKAQTLAQSKVLPLTTEQLIESLEVSYPPRCIGKNESLEDHYRYAGASELVQTLRSLLERSL